MANTTRRSIEVIFPGGSSVAIYMTISFAEGDDLYTVQRRAYDVFNKMAVKTLCPKDLESPVSEPSD